MSDVFDCDECPDCNLPDPGANAGAGNCSRCGAALAADQYPYCDPCLAYYQEGWPMPDETTCSHGPHLRGSAPGFCDGCRDAAYPQQWLDAAAEAICALESDKNYAIMTAGELASVILDAVVPLITADSQTHEACEALLVQAEDYAREATVTERERCARLVEQNGGGVWLADVLRGQDGDDDG